MGMVAGRRLLLLAATVAGVAGCAGTAHRDSDIRGTRRARCPRQTPSAAGDGPPAAGRPGRRRAPLRTRGRAGRGERDRARLAVDLSSLALAYDMLGRSVEAGPTYERALPLLEEALGPEHPEVAKCLANLGALDWRQGAAAEARPLAERAPRSPSGRSAPTTRRRRWRGATWR